MPKTKDKKINLKNDKEKTKIKVDKKLTDKKIIENLKTEISEQKTQFLTSLADLDNDRKRFEVSKKEFIKFSNQIILSDLLDILDNFNSAMNMKNPSPEVKNFLIGFKMLSEQFTQLLNNNNVEVILTKPGDDFQPKLHSSVEEVENTEIAKGKIVFVIKEGYTFHGRLLRPSVVKIAK